MNRFTDLSREVREEIESERRAKENEIERNKRQENQKKQHEAKLLTEVVIPILSQARDGLMADGIKTEVDMRGGQIPAAILEIDGRTMNLEENDNSVKLILGTPSTCTVTTAGNAFVIETSTGSGNDTTEVATRVDLEDVIAKAVRTLLRHHHNPFNL